jgi:hypothetical protein
VQLDAATERRLSWQGRAFLRPPRMRQGERIFRNVRPPFGLPTRRAPAVVGLWRGRRSAAPYHCGLVMHRGVGRAVLCTPRMWLDKRIVRAVFNPKGIAACSPATVRQRLPWVCVRKCKNPNGVLANAATQAFFMRSQLRARMSVKATITTTWIVLPTIIWE